ncbi:MAG TPA: hypothetical protein VFM10_08030 [Terriglobales bacterium]|nr:hypothetical protein [Terriglobales bacterium]
MSVVLLIVATSTTLISFRFLNVLSRKLQIESKTALFDADLTMLPKLIQLGKASIDRTFTGRRTPQ